MGEIKKVILETEHGWLAPDGDLYRCAYGEHDRIAQDIIHMNNLDTKCGESYGLVNVTHVLEKNGWIKIQKKEAYLPDHLPFDAEWFVTKEQYNFIHSYYDFHGHREMAYPDLRIK